MLMNRKRFLAILNTYSVRASESSNVEKGCLKVLVGEDDDQGD